MAREVSILPFNLDDLLHCRGVESERVEFKATWDPRTTGPQVLRTICAFANDFHNLNGGYVVIGVDERDGRGRLPPRGLSEAQVDAAQKWIRGQCNRLDPPYAPVLSPERVGQRLLLVVWAPASDMRPHQAPTGAMGSGEKGTRRYFVRLGSETVDAQRHPHLLRGLVEQTARVPWDDRALRQARQEDMREAKVREFLREVGSSLLDEPDAREIFRRLRLVLRVNDHEVPRNIGVLCFSNDPTQWFRGAAIQVVRFTAGAAGDVQEERVFRGALVDQVRDCLAYLRNLSAVYFHKQADDIHTQRTASYPFAALQEALVNAVYHRGYDVDQPEPTKVFVYPDRVVIASYPGPVPGIQREHLARDAKAIPAAPARNRRIGEFLKELGLAEGHLSGLPKIYAAMADNGSPEPHFEFDDERTYFQATLPAHPQHAAVAAVRDAAGLRTVGNRKDAYSRLGAALAVDRSSPQAPAILQEMATCVSGPAAGRDDSWPPLAWGVDGCKGGWLYVAIGETGEFCYGVATYLTKIIDAADSLDRVFVDIPIGLPDEHMPGPRKCDKQARWLLNRDSDKRVLPASERRSSSVFPAPVRDVLAATDYEDACCRNERITRNRISKQTWAIARKIREMDDLMQSSRKAHGMVSEVHPELCFRGLNGSRPMAHRKRDQTGYEERLAVLCECWPCAEDAAQAIRTRFPKKIVADDDILDAMVAALTARARKLSRLPADPERDSTGLPMQMVWTVRENVVWR